MRILFLSSLAHLAGEINFDDLQVHLLWALHVHALLSPQLHLQAGVLRGGTLPRFLRSVFA